MISSLGAKILSDFPDITPASARAFIAPSAHSTESKSSNLLLSGVEIESDGICCTGIGVTFVLTGML